MKKLQEKLETILKGMKRKTQHSKTYEMQIKQCSENIYSCGCPY